MAPEARINFAARFEYLQASEQLRPEVLSDLHRHTFAVYRTYLQSNSKGAALPTLAHLSAALRDSPSPDLIDFDHALHQWANTQGLTRRLDVGCGRPDHVQLGSRRNSWEMGLFSGGTQRTKVSAKLRTLDSPVHGVGGLQKS